MALEQEEQAWMRAYEARSTEFRELARQALKDLAEGDTYLMTVEDGRLEAR